MKHKIYLGLGSNVGDRRAHLEAGLAALPPAVGVLRRSPIYETEPWGFTDQADFLNMVIEGETDLSPQELLKGLKDIEAQVGRKPTFRNGPRELDIDMLLYDDLILAEGRLRVPHPALHDRAFVLAPLADLAPELQIPGGEATVIELLGKVDASTVRRLEKIE
jgi:2-amino-4-hydroxy-6-hydroxymethyldihydropteridine diphosphokinase